ncbi:MAG: transporter related protein [Anaerosolibacter sp.]|jgi:ATP-binding cassette subfamily B protein|uniref:ABC transporter ATP-binding protein n=1 Tax=Anaerosolibacter sp. TaxID=1872527 RepID=UPI00262A27A3|nr:ABC transporter ATP-binding protein [Anaerosolibacter sp.]MDF2546819.1 transporter related protein [Anaerosolibacter sp.]
MKNRTEGDKSREYNDKVSLNYNIQKDASKNYIGYHRIGKGHRGGPIERAKNFKGTIKRLWHYFEGERNYIIGLSFLIISSAVLGLTVPYLIGRAIDEMTHKEGIETGSLLAMIVLILFFVYMLDAIISFFQGWIMAGVSQRIVKQLRSSLFQKLQKLPISFFDLHTHGEIMSRLVNDIENVSSTISQSTIHLLASLFIISGSLYMMIWLSPLLTLASIVTIPLVFIVSRFTARKTRVFFKEQQQNLGRLNGHIEEAISGIFVVKAFHHEVKVINEFSEINHQLCKVGIKAQIWAGFIMPLLNVINNIGFSLVAGVGGVLAVREMITIGVIASFLSYSRQFVRPLNEVSSIYNTLQSAIAGAERVFEVLDVEEEPKDRADAKVLENPKGHVIFRDVTFGYQQDIPIIRGINFEVSPGSTVALVGPTGAGKTTIISLLTRFYDVSSGSISIDGVDIRAYTRKSLGNCFGVVLQDTYLFTGTIRDNIRYGRLDASDEEVESAARLANADVFIRRMPKGYETKITENAGNLSQGQKQLLAIARAILANPSILILDEATSNVDTRTELHIQEALLKLLKSRTSFIIAHRLSTIRNADMIMVIDKGQIVEQGDHDELLQKRGLYYRLYFNQFKNISI